MRNEIIAAERRVWDALVRGDAAADHAVLHADFIGVYPSGRCGRAGHADQLSGGPTVSTYALHDITVRALGTDHALICYRAEFQRPGRTTAEAMHVSSIWVRQSGSWTNIFSQDTLAQ